MYGHMKVKDRNSVSIGPEAGNMAGNKLRNVAGLSVSCCIP
jgi:hypothetical protein